MSATVFSPDDTTEDDEVEAPDRSRRRLVLGAVLVVVLAALATYAIAFSTLFSARTVTVHGASGALAAQVRRAAAVDAGAPLIRLDTAAVADRVQAIPRIAAARVTTSFPSTVLITVSERVAIGVVRSAAGFLLVDRTGAQYATVARRPHGLPLFVVAKGTAARPIGEAVATVAAALPRRLLNRVDSIQALDARAITLLLENGRVVRWGSSDRSSAKARILPALLQRGGTQFDITDPDRPFSR